MDKGTVIVTKVQKREYGEFPRTYQGMISVYHDNLYLYSKYTGINRMNAADAKQDAEILKAEFQDETH